MKPNEILRQFEEDLIAGKNPTPAEYKARYGPIDAETKSLMEVMMGLVLLGEEAQLPPGFEERQRKLARDLIARKKAEEMVAHWQAGERAFKKGDFARASEHYERLLTFVKYLKDEPWIAFASSRLGNMADALGHTEKALEYDRTAAELYRKLGMKRELAICQHNSGNLYLAKKDYLNARKAYQEAIELNEKSGAALVLAHEYLNSGAIEKFLGNSERAEKYYQTSYELFSSRQDTNGMASAEYNLGELMEGLDQTAEAIRFYESALTHFARLGDRLMVARTAGVLGSLYISRNQPQKARTLFKRAMDNLPPKKEKRPPRSRLIAPEIPDEAKSDPARLLRFLLDKDAEEMLYQKS